MTRDEAQVAKILGIVTELGAGLEPGGAVLDFGCGRGALVREMRALGYRAFGCDIEFAHTDDAEMMRMLEDGVIRMIDENPYRLPFEDDTFDLVFSYQVFEHVQNCDEAISEMARVLKPGGAVFHIFTPRHVLIEPHTYVPLATMIRSLPWLRLWAALGVRNEFQGGLPAAETARLNREYLISRTKYLPAARMRSLFAMHFGGVSFSERVALKHALNRHGIALYNASRYIPVIPWLVGIFGKRALFAAAPRKPRRKGTVS